jgi:hypothetical protein
MTKKSEVIQRDEVVIRFSGDSGDGMQLTGTLFSDTAALFGNDLSTFPDYPAEIRAPSGTVGGVSGFQVHLGHSEVNTPGDYADVLVAMNPAAIKANAMWIKPGGTVIYDESKITHQNIKELYSKLSLKLAVIDAFEAIEGDGSVNGDIVPAHWAIATSNPVAADCLACTLMGINFKNVGYLSLLEKGEEEYYVGGDDWQKAIKKFKMPTDFDKIKNWE